MAGTSPELERPLLASFGPGDWHTEAWKVEPIRYRAELAATLRFTVQARDDTIGRTDEKRFYAKVYHDEEGEPGGAQSRRGPGGLTPRTHTYATASSPAQRGRRVRADRDHPAVGVPPSGSRDRGDRRRRGRQPRRGSARADPPRSEAGSHSARRRPSLPGEPRQLRRGRPCSRCRQRPGPPQRYAFPLPAHARGLVVDGGAGLRRGVLLSCSEDLAQKAPHPLRRRRPEGFRRLFPTPGAGLAGQDRNAGGGRQSLPGG